MMRDGGGSSDEAAAAAVDGETGNKDESWGDLADAPFEFDPDDPVCIP